MTFGTCSPDRLHTAPSTAALCLIGGLLLLLLAYVPLRLDIEPFWVFLALPAALLAMVVIRQLPIFLMVAMVYVGTFKTRGAAGVSMTDPTLLVAVLLYAAVMLKVLLLAAGAGNRSLRDLFAGQMGGVSAFCLLILAIAISYTYTPAPAVGGDKVLKLVAFDVPIFFAPLILLRTARDVRQVLLLSMLGSLILAGRTLHRVQHPTPEVLFGEQDPTQIGDGLLMGAAALMALYYSFVEKRILRVALIGCIVALTCGVMVSLSRSAILSLLLVATASLLFLRHRSTTVSRGTLLIAAMAALLTASFVGVWLWRQPATHSKFAAKAIELRRSLRGMGPAEGTAAQRYSFSESALQAFFSKPLLGWGAGGWSTLWHYGDERVVKYPHNFILEIAAEQGLVGLAALAWLLLAMFGACAKVLRTSERSFVFIVPVVALSLLGNTITGQVETRDMWLWCGTLFALARMAHFNDASNPVESRTAPVAYPTA